MRSSGRDLYPKLLTASRQAFAAGHYETAYHALMAALHAAQDREDADRLEQVAELASRDQVELNASAPDNHLATGGHGRAGPGLFELAAHQARIRADMIRRRHHVPDGVHGNRANDHAH